MTTPPVPVCDAARVGLSVVLVCSLAFTAKASSSAETKAAPKTQVLFMGADIAVEKDKAFHRVEDVTTTSLLIKMGGKPVKVPLSDSANLRINESLKIARSSVEIDALKFERAYTIGADPFDQLARSAALAASNTAMSDIARGNVLRANAMVATAGGQGSAASGGQDMGRALAEQARSESEFSQSLDTPISEVYDVTGQSVKASGEEKYDAIRITFAVTPKKELKQPYLGVIAQIRDRDSKPGQIRKWAYVQALGAMSAGVSRNVLIYRGGLPPGYILENCEVHFYASGEELATNLSRKRVPLTEDEAGEYRIIEYVSANKGRTLPATLITTTLDRDVRAALTPAQLSETYHVRIAKNGRVTAAFRDATGKEPLKDPALESALKTVRFQPALEAGKPVELIVPLNLGELAPP